LWGEFTFPGSPRAPRGAASARGLASDRPITAAYARMVDRHATGRALGFLGEPAVSVLPLNLALDGQVPMHAT
jgi:K+-transporting ATPase ATPase C chain